MAFPTEYLNDHETIAADLRPHPLYFFQAVAALVGSIVFGLFVLAATDADTLPRTWLGWLAFAMIVGSIVWVIARYVGWISTYFVVTSDRVIYRSGILHKQGAEIPLERVNTVRFSQRLIERLFNTGDLEIESGATEGMQRFTDIRDPDAVQKLIHQQIDLRSRPRGEGVAAAPADVATQLEKLEGMLERGTLTAEEFAAQKQKLLGS
jgi:uncharacterized membrane protein YdbT with pleckstrin-like domain